MYVAPVYPIPRVSRTNLKCFVHSRELYWRTFTTFEPIVNRLLKNASKYKFGREYRGEVADKREER